MSEENKKNKNTDENDIIESEIDDVIIESEEESLNSFGDKTSDKLREKLNKAVEEKQEYLAGWQRAKADLINARKDFGEQKTDLLKYANTDLILQLIPVLDSFEMALKNVDESDENLPAGQAGLKVWSQGVRHIYSQLMSILESNGVKQINPLNEEFNHELHTSVENVKVDEATKKNIIVEVVQKGYELNGKIIREAKVKVSE
ncbi:nucleotide exchange factor GrpE [Patescibacteria group bacterium]|nr:nucleotide exchange factor GrpE [Patescibacteria group bacterium]